MDTIIFGVLLIVSIIIVLSKQRWLAILSWSVAAVMIALLSQHQVTSLLDWNF